MPSAKTKGFSALHSNELFFERYIERLARPKSMGLGQRYTLNKFTHHFHSNGSSQEYPPYQEYKEQRQQNYWGILTNEEVEVYFLGSSSVFLRVLS